MKNSPLSAVVLISIAGLVGGIALVATSDDRIESNPDVVARPAIKTPTVMEVTPHQRKLERRLEQAEQEIEQYKKTGKVLANGAIKTIDESGTPLYVHPELIEGKGRYGEPLFMMATYKKKAAVPLLSKYKAPKSEKMATMRKLPRGQTPLTMGGKRPETQQMDAPAEGGDEGGAKNGGGKAPNKPGDANQQTSDG